MVYMDKNLKSLSLNKNGYYGWGVLSGYPWHLHGVYNSQKKQRKSQKCYRVIILFFMVFISL